MSASVPDERKRHGGRSTAARSPKPVIRSCEAASKRVSAGACGLANPVCAVYRVRPSRAVSKHLKSIAPIELEVAMLQLSGQTGHNGRLGKA